MENAEVLEMTVKKVEDILKNRDQGMLSYNYFAIGLFVFYVQT